MKGQYDFKTHSTDHLVTTGYNSFPYMAGGLLCNGPAVGRPEVARNDSLWMVFWLVPLLLSRVGSTFWPANTEKKRESQRL